MRALVVVGYTTPQREDSAIAHVSSTICHVIYTVPNSTNIYPSSIQYLRQIAKMGKNGVQAENQLVDFIGLSKSHFWQKWLKTQIGEGIVHYYGLYSLIVALCHMALNLLRLEAELKRGIKARHKRAVV